MSSFDRARSSARTSALLALAGALALGAAACGASDRDTRSTGGTRRGDAGSVFHADATTDVPDAGEVPGLDASAEPDASSTHPDAATVHPDAFVPSPDATVPDSGPEADAGVAPIDLRIRDVQDPSSAVHPAVDTSVRFSNVVVTAIYPGGSNMGSFWAEESIGGPYSGVFVYVPTSLVGRWPMNVGDRVTFSGKYTEYYDLSEIVLENVEVVSAGTALSPDVRSASDLLDSSSVAEAWEGVLVRIDGLVVTSSNPDAPQDFGEFTANDVRIDDALYRLEPRPAPGQTVQSVTGVVHYTFGHFKLLPRSAADIGPIQ